MVKVKAVKKTKEQPIEMPVVETVIKATDDFERTVGRRKCASARVRFNKGKGHITVNDKPLKEYFSFFEQEIVTAPLKTLAKEKDYDISARVLGGGKKGQAVAIQHGIARALVKWNPDFKKTLKTLGFMTRDARVKERKKPGLKKARRAPQWSKR